MPSATSAAAATHTPMPRARASFAVRAVHQLASKASAKNTMPYFAATMKNQCSQCVWAASRLTHRYRDASTRSSNDDPPDVVIDAYGHDHRNTREPKEWTSLSTTRLCEWCVRAQSA